MKPFPAMLRFTLTTMVLGTFALACGDSPTGPDSDINPGLLDPGNAFGLASETSGTLPQGSAVFTGPGGMTMDATAEEFIQQLTLRNGTVLKTSGLAVLAVPDEAVSNAPFDRLGFVSANTGSLQFEPVGTHIISEWPEMDFIHVVPVTSARIRMSGTTDYAYADEGVITIESVSYFKDVYPCQYSSSTVVVDVCEYQIGLVQGTVEFTVNLGDGSQVVQETSSFAIPIRRRTIVGEQSPS